MQPAPPHARDVVRLAVPAFFTLLAEPLFLITDSAIVGHLGTLPLAGLGAASTLLASATGIFVFLAYATTASVARFIGADQHEQGVQAGLDGAWLALTLGLPLAGATALFAHPLSTWMAGDAAAPLATDYLRISALALPAILLNLALTGLFRGFSNTRTPLIVTTAGFGFNAGLNAFLVFQCHLGIAGSAWGTTVATWGMTGAQIGIIVRTHPTIARQKPHLSRIFQAMRDGLPLLVRTVALRGILVLLTALAASFSVTTLAAHQIVSNVFTFESFALDALAIAAQTLIAQALGREDKAQIRSLTTLFLKWSFWCGCALGVIILMGAPLLPRIFTTQHSVQAAVGDSLVLIAAITPIAAILFVLDGVLMGAGDGVFLAKVQVLLFVLFMIGFALTHVTRSSLSSHTPAVQLLSCWALYCSILILRTMFLLHRSRQDTWMTTST